MYTKTCIDAAFLMLFLRCCFCDAAFVMPPSCQKDRIPLEIQCNSVAHTTQYSAVKLMPKFEDRH